MSDLTGKALHEHILSLGKSKGYRDMTALCKAAKVARSTMSEFSKERSQEMSKTVAQKFADLLEVSLDVIYGRSDDTKKAPTSNEADERIRLTQEEADLIAEYRKLTEGRKEAIRLSLRAYQESE